MSTMYTLERETIIPAPREEVFAFFADARNLAQITPKWIGVRVERTDELPIRPGFRIEHPIRWLGVRIRWSSVIAEYDPPVRFLDRQVRGPYRHWEHEHTFVEHPDGTLMRDRVQYELPFGILGAVTHRLIVARQLERIFDYRARRIRKMFAHG
jgi:ligand-binding SRPBCC domain-containing protein